MNFKTPPYAHQLAEFQQHRETPWRAILWEQGLGKSWITINTAAWNYLRGNVDALVVIAPNGVHSNWAIDELPAHLPDEVAQDTRVHCYWSSRAHNIGETVDREVLLEYTGFAILLMSYDAVMTDVGAQYLKRFLERRRCFLVLDEAVRIKSPGSKRTKRIVAAGKYARYKRILTGTPIANNPMDLYSPFKFLDYDFWNALGCRTFDGFKTRFGIWETARGVSGKTWPQLRGFRNMDLLRETIKPHVTRLRKDEVLDLPPKIYQTRRFAMSKQQEKLYRELEREFTVWVEGPDVDVDAPLAVVRLLRLQQITCGYIPVGEDEPVHRIEGPNPRLDALMEELEEIDHPAIVFCRFKLDIEIIGKALRNAGISYVEYQGSTTDSDRIKARQDFQSGRVRIFLANTATAAEGLTLHAARSVFYYSQTFKYDERRQSEDRAHRIGQVHPVNYVDLAAIGTVDSRIVRALRKKQHYSDIVLGDIVRDWI